MEKLTRENLLSLEQYDQQRLDFRRQVMAHKNHRRLTLGQHLTVLFEDRLTIQYQVQEMLRIERIYNAAAIAEELEAYNPLIPDGSNWKAVLMIEYSDPSERQLALQQLLGIEGGVWIAVHGFDKVYPIADEDLTRATEDKTSAVHFLRYEFSDEMINAMKNNVAVMVGVEHASYPSISITLPVETMSSLIKDFD